METLDLSFASSVASSDESCAKNEQNEMGVDVNCFYNFYSLHFSVGRVSMTASPSEEELQSFHEVQS
jgi:hypothetical protein